jgi:rSAM/selenodomain-associated transferase 1
LVPTLLIFAKAPVAGQAKTRLIPLLGAEGAAKLAHRMLLTTCAEAEASGLPVELWVSPQPSAPEWQGLLPPVSSIHDQGPGNLGDRLARATQRVIARGDAAILIGTDCPGLDRERLRAAADAVEHCDAFIHPTEDGGYALLALRRFSPELFLGIPWSTASVFTATLHKLDELGWSYKVGCTLRDIDEPRDVVECLPSDPDRGGVS